MTDLRPEKPKKKEERRTKKERIASLVLASLVLASIGLGAQALRAVPRVTIDELKTLMAQQSVVILDVRTADEFAQGRIPGAININYTEVFKEAGRFAGE